MSTTIKQGQTAAFGDASTVTVTSVTELPTGSVSVSAVVSPNHAPGSEKEVAFIVEKSLMEEPDTNVDSVLIAAAAAAPSALAWAFNFGGDTLALESARRAALRVPDGPSKAASAVASAQYANGRLSHVESEISRMMEHATRNI